MDWWRSWHGAPTDPKWLMIADVCLCSPSIVVAVAWQLLDHASQQDDRGSTLGFNVNTAAWFLRISPETIFSIINAMNGAGIIKNDRLAAWEKRQPNRERHNDISTARVQKHRAKLHVVKRHETP